MDETQRNGDDVGGTRIHAVYDVFVNVAIFLEKLVFSART